MAKDEIKGFDTALNDTKNLENGKTYDKYEKTIKNYFIDMAEEEIKDGDLICTHMIYYSKDLKIKIVLKKIYFFLSVIYHLLICK